MRIELEDQEVRALMGILMTQPWNVANPLLVKFTQQMQMEQKRQMPEMPLPPKGNNHDADRPASQP